MVTVMATHEDLGIAHQVAMEEVGKFCNIIHILDEDGGCNSVGKGHGYTTIRREFWLSEILSDIWKEVKHSGA